MKKVNYYITEKQDKRLRQLSKESGLTVSELIRRALDYYLERKKGKG
jgi:predicted DNA-binding protein